jgi:hypothetical protein
MACGPPIALNTSGMVMNGPTPIMSIMLSAVALPSPIPRIKPVELESFCERDCIFSVRSVTVTAAMEEATSCR